ncbi:MAG TPA: hypothetical protein QF487_05815 [Acidimicrobiales bacterium]|nr:hypothetical protein [Acidimicrobiales bacterium]
MSFHEKTFRRIDRTFAFIDLSGFTAYADERGDAAGMEIINGFRNRVSWQHKKEYG